MNISIEQILAWANDAAKAHGVETMSFHPVLETFASLAYEAGVAAQPATEESSATQPAQLAVPEGWKLVPIKPTPEMLAVCDEDVGSKIIDGPAFAEAVWMGFLAAAPEKGQP